MPLQDLTPQLRTRLRRVERLVGFFIGVATLLLLAGFIYYVYHTAARQGWFVPKMHYYTLTMSGEGLKVGDPVLMIGFPVGQITRIEAQPPESYYPVYVEFEIRQPYYGYIWSDSKLRITSAGFLGARQLVVLKGFAGKPTVIEKGRQVAEVLTADGYVSRSKVKTLYLAPLEEPALTERAEKLVAQVEAALPAFLGLTNQLNRVLENAVQITANVNTTLVGVQPVITNAVAITANLRDPHGSLGEWLLPPALNSGLTGTVTNLNEQLTILSGNLNQTLLNLASITSNLNSQVEANDQILSEISDLVRESNDLLQGLKKHWLVRGAFRKTSTATNAPPVKITPARPAPAPTPTP